MSFSVCHGLLSLTGSREVWLAECDKNHREWEESSVSPGLVELPGHKGSDFCRRTAYWVLQLLICHLNLP